jgi:hypothetical protein
MATSRPVGPTDAMLMARGYLAACDAQYLPPRCAAELRRLLGWLAGRPLDDDQLCAFLRERIRSGAPTPERLAAALVFAHWRHGPTRAHWIEQGRLGPWPAAPTPAAAAGADATGEASARSVAPGEPGARATARRYSAGSAAFRSTGSPVSSTSATA